jgi:hypothetical protein
MRFATLFHSLDSDPVRHEIVLSKPQLAGVMFFESVAGWVTGTP